MKSVRRAILPSSTQSLILRGVWCGRGRHVLILQGYGWSTKGQIIAKLVRNAKNLTSNLTQGIYSFYKLDSCRRNKMLNECLSLKTLKTKLRSTASAHYDMCMIPNLFFQQRSWKWKMKWTVSCKHEMEGCWANKEKRNKEHITHDSFSRLSIGYTQLKTIIMTYKNNFKVRIKEWQQKEYFM